MGIAGVWVAQRIVVYIVWFINLEGQKIRSPHCHATPLIPALRRKIFHFPAWKECKARTQRKEQRTKFLVPLPYLSRLQAVFFNQHALHGPHV